MVTAQVARPFPDRPLEGQLGIYVEMSPLCTRLDAAAAGPRDEDARQALTRLLERLFKSGRAVDTESLCILPGEQVWSLRLDLRVLDSCGNVADAAVLAALAALVDFRRPDSTVIDGKATIVPRRPLGCSNAWQYTAFEKHPVPLTIQYQPVATTFALLDLSEGTTTSHSNTRLHVLVDPSDLEDQVAAGHITLAMNRQGELLVLSKVGGPGLDPELLHTHCVGLAKAKAVSFGDQLGRALAARPK